MEVLRKAFAQQLAKEVSDFVACIDDDKSIVDADITGSIAHVHMLEQVGLLTEQQAENIISGLQQLRAAYERGDCELQPKWEDVHMNVEKQLESIAGADALRLHTARS